MRRVEKPSARFLGLLHGQAVIRGDTDALVLIERRARDRNIMASVSRHSSSYVLRRFSLDWMQTHDVEDQQAPKIRHDQIDTADTGIPNEPAWLAAQRLASAGH